jgi:hypothetical protein
MRIRTWNAFASNNSGSYVIVGRFPSEALASDVAAELREVALAHSAWLDAHDDRESAGSPLAAYATKLGLAYEPSYDDWPQYSGGPPSVWSIDHQIFVYSDYTVTMPRVIGHALYARGGRVETEIDHAHHPIVAMFEVYFPWQTRDQMDVPARVQELVDALCADDGVLVSHGVPYQAPAWQGTTAECARGFGEPDLIIGAVFDQLAAGFTAVATAVDSVGAKLRVRVMEALHDGDTDALATLRPCTPHPTTRAAR